MRKFLLLLLSSLFFFLLKHLFTPRGRQRSRDHRDHTGENDIGDMVRDPVCATFIIKRDAIKQKKDGEIHYFCSKECAEKFLMS